MRCSDCSETIKPVVAIDIDGTLGDYHGHFLAFAEEYLGDMPEGLARHTYNGQEPFSDWFCNVYEVDRRTWGDIKLAYRQGAMKRSMPIYMGARELCDAMLAHGAELWLTTTRPHLRLDNVDPDTRAWLSRHGIVFDYMLYDEDKYKILADRVDPERIVAVLDDLPEQYEQALQLFGSHVATLRGNAYNRDALPAASRVLSLFEARAAIGIKINAWKAIHE